MATIIAVHGTFANSPADTAAGNPPPEAQWFEPHSAFEQDMRSLLAPADGQLDVVPFRWNGLNSEIDRREAGIRLNQKFSELEARNEPYCVIGHSHGGSIVSSALLASAARKQKLANLKRWITIGTPFVTMRKERFLLTRLSLNRKVILVASMMLFLMFAVYIIATAFSTDNIVFGRIFPRILLFTGLMTVVPALLIWALFSYLDSRSLLGYNRRAVARAREAFAGRWRSLSHPDDEAIQGLTLLPDAKLSFFDPMFAVPAITLVSVVALPIFYLYVLTSPSTMVSLAEWLKNRVYDSRVSPAAEAALKDLQLELAAARKSQGENVNLDTAKRENNNFKSQNNNFGNQQNFGNQTNNVQIPSRRAAFQQYRAKRDQLKVDFPKVDIDTVERGLRFKSRFFEKDGVPCGGLCGGGTDIAINSGLLLHIVTDEFSWALGAADIADPRGRRLLFLAVPLIIVPLAFGLAALALMLIIRSLATGISEVASASLNRITNAEVRRAAFGNDTEGEIATGAIDRPAWLERSPPRLPLPLADLITDYSNLAASQSLAKFRRAIGQIASAEPKHSADTAISTYFTWKELVHSSYFDVPEFRKLVAQAVSRVDGFAPSAQFLADPDFERTAEWLAEIETAPPPADTPPDSKDKKAVSAVVASTVKANP